MSDLTLYVRKQDGYNQSFYTFFEDDPYGETTVDIALTELFDHVPLTPELLRQAADILEQHLKEG